MYNELLKNGGFSEFAGLSTDEKPVNGRLSTGSTFTEVDTGDVYMYDAEDASWTKQFSLQGGGGGGGGGGASGMVVEFEYDDTDGNYRFVSTTAAADVIAAYAAGTPVVFYIPGSTTYGVKEGYITPVSYAPAQEYYGNEEPAQFASSSSAQFGNIANSFTVDASGYLEATIYVD